jgi:lipopolysaccharide biosynthesis glycosyltransferase
MIRVFIGYEPSETIAFHVLAHSIYRHAKRPVSVAGVILRQLPLLRPRDEKQSTEFAFSRFLVPYMCDYKGMSVFMDCDMLCRGDIAELVNAADWSKPVSVVKHDYVPKAEAKFQGHEQTTYGRKNWSSVMVFNNALCTCLTPRYVDSVHGLELHQFGWLMDYAIGELPREWNHLVGEFDPNPDAKLVHYTIGGPWFAKYRFCEFAEEWFAERDLMLHHDRTLEYSKPEKVSE